MQRRNNYWSWLGCKSKPIYYVLSKHNCRHHFFPLRPKVKYAAEKTELARSWERSSKLVFRRTHPAPPPQTSSCLPERRAKSLVCTVAEKKLIFKEPHEKTTQTVSEAARTPNNGGKQGCRKLQCFRSPQKSLRRNKETSQIYQKSEPIESSGSSL